jgi:plastocyanin
MGKPKKGGYPPPQPITNFIEITDGKINPAAVTIAWGDLVVWTNKDAVSYSLAVCTNGQPDSNKIWRVLAGNTSSAPLEFDWSQDKGKDPFTYEYGMLPPGTAKATITAQISRF